ncbi:hypothetical protein DFP72DRAFT_324435 [Ephemerocybe angulata]|uniref:NYN domain-containing protein n=1 Tax=Ephemerocybe angulata TaxID=980116 RepID=A0A8H6IIC7_9AGAR|nr:hypothetical protein DFP72DRAFT_324435 [Tulosesus angulatus]
MQSSGVSLTDVPGRKDVADRMLIVDMLAYAFERPPSTTTLILITAETAFAYCLSVLRMREYRVALLTPEQMSTSSLIAQVPICFDWAPDVVEEEDPPSPQPQRPKNPSQTSGTPQPRGDSTKEPAIVRCAADPTVNSSKQFCPNPTDKHLSAANTFPLSYSVTIEEEVDIEDYLPRKREAAKSATEDLFHVSPTLAERHTTEAANALPPAVSESDPLPDQTIEQEAQWDKTPVETPSPESPPSSPPSQTDHLGDAKRLEDINAYRYTSSENSYTTDLSDDGNHPEPVRSSSCPPEPPGPAVSIEQPHALEAPPIHSRSPLLPCSSPPLSQAIEQQYPTLEHDSLAEVEVESFPLFQSINPHDAAESPATPELSCFLDPLSVPEAATDADHLGHGATSSALGPTESPAFSPKDPPSVPLPPPPPALSTLTSEPSPQEWISLTGMAQGASAAESEPQTLPSATPPPEPCQPESTSPAAQRFCVLINLMEEYRRSGVKLVNRAQLGIDLPKRKKGLYAQAGFGNVNKSGRHYVEAAIDADVLTWESETHVSLNPAILPKAPSPHPSTSTHPPEPSATASAPVTFVRPAIDPHFDALVAILDNYLRCFGHPSVYISNLQTQLLKRRPDVFSLTGLSSSDDALRLYIDAAIDAKVVVRNTESTVTLHPTMVQPKDSIASGPAPPSPPSMTSALNRHPIVPPHFDVLIVVMKEYRKKGQTSVNRADLGTELPKKKADVYVQAGYGKSSKPLRKYIEAAIEAGVLVRDSDEFVSLHRNILHPPVAPHYRILVAYMKEARGKGQISVWRADLGVELPKRQPNLYAEARLLENFKPFKAYADNAIESGILIRDNADYVSLHPSYW